MELKTKKKKGLSIRGRVFTKSDLSVIRKCVIKYYAQGRTFISKEICEALDWKQPNGWLKDRACRDVLLRLDALKLIKLPKSKVVKKKKKKGKTQPSSKKYKLASKVKLMPNEIILKFAKGNGDEKLWNTVVNDYHYLGHRVTVGRCIKYLIYGDTKLLGAIAFSSPANRLGVRDEFLEDKFGFDIDDIKKFVINNTRFLILPNVKVKNLASTILSKATQQIVLDWEQYYSVAPAIVETFVQISRFEGTCYKAANWTCIGETKGFSKKGNNYVANKEPKKIFVYGLNKAARKQLVN